jgi:cytochrome c oxidase subunit 2
MNNTQGMSMKRAQALVPFFGDAALRASVKASCALSLGLAAVAGTASASTFNLPGGPQPFQLNLPVPATRIAAEQNWLHWAMMIICLVIFVAVFGVMFYSIWKHRKSLGHKPATFHESTAVEIAWTIVPFLIVIGMALMATKLLVAQKDTTNADLTIKVTGIQWKWGYEYIKGEG